MYKRQAGALNYGAVICLLPDNHPKRATGAGAILRSQRVDYIHQPVDWLAPTQADLDRFVQALERLLTQGLKVHVYFALSMRVGGFCAVYLFERGLMTHDQAQTLLEQVWAEPPDSVGASLGQAFGGSRADGIKVRRTSLSQNPQRLWVPALNYLRTSRTRLVSQLAGVLDMQQGALE